MTPILLVANDKRQVNSYIKDLAKKHSVLPAFTFEILAEPKEISIDQIREIKKQVAFSFSEPRIFVLYSFDTASYQAQNAFLKTLEEHEENIFFVLVVSSLYQILATIRSRSQVVDVRKKKEDLLEASMEQDLLEIISSAKNTYLTKKLFQVKTSAEGVKTCGFLLLFFRDRLEKDTNATTAIRQIIKTQALILHNNVNPQYAVDRLIIGLHKTYQNK